MKAARVRTADGREFLTTEVCKDEHLRELEFEFVEIVDITEEEYLRTPRIESARIYMPPGAIEGFEKRDREKF